MLMRGGLEFGFYAEETDGVLLDKHEVLLERRLRPPELHHRPPRGAELRRHGRGRRRDLPGRGAGDRLAGDRLLSRRPARQHGDHAAATCATRRWATRARWATPFASPTTTSTATRPASPATRCRRPAIPGFPADSVEVDHNYIYANNFNVYDAKSAGKPLVGVPVGAGIIYAGMNDAKVHDNWFFDNWRFGTMLLAVPDALTSYGGAEGEVFPGSRARARRTTASPRRAATATSPTRWARSRPASSSRGLDRYKVPHGGSTAGALPNGVDFWWDEFLVQPLELLVRQHRARTARRASVTGSGEAGRHARPSAQHASRLRRRDQPRPERGHRRRRQGGST